MVTKEKLWEILEEVKDPEVPVLSIVDLGIVREVNISPDKTHIKITPTYSGCPAMQVIEKGIVEACQAHQIDNVEVELTLSPAWTTDWISEKGRKNLLEYGIAPPVNEPDKSVLFAEAIVVPCPLCKSQNTRMISQFGSTACKAHYQCNDCKEPFDYFKCLK